MNDRGAMRAVVQRVSRARVSVGGDVTGEIGLGLMICWAWGAKTLSLLPPRWRKSCESAHFEDENGKMNLSLLDAKGAALVVSQFTLYGDARGGRRPSFIAAAPPELAKRC